MGAMALHNPVYTGRDVHSEFRRDANQTYEEINQSNLTLQHQYTYMGDISFLNKSSTQNVHLSPILSETSYPNEEHQPESQPFQDQERVKALIHKRYEMQELSSPTAEVHSSKDPGLTNIEYLSHNTVVPFDPVTGYSVLLREQSHKIQQAPSPEIVYESIKLKDNPAALINDKLSDMQSPSAHCVGSSKSNIKLQSLALVQDSDTPFSSHPPGYSPSSADAQVVPVDPETGYSILLRNERHQTPCAQFPVYDSVVKLQTNISSITHNEISHNDVPTNCSSPMSPTSAKPSSLPQQKELIPTDPETGYSMLLVTNDRTERPPVSFLGYDTIPLEGNGDKEAEQTYSSLGGTHLLCSQSPSPSSPNFGNNHSKHSPTALPESSEIEISPPLPE